MGGIAMGRETDAKPSRTACIRTHVLHVHTGCGFVGRAAWVYFVDVVPQRSLGPCEVSLVLVLAVVAGISFVDIDVGDDAQKPGSRAFSNSGASKRHHSITCRKMFCRVSGSRTWWGRLSASRCILRSRRRTATRHVEQIIAKFVFPFEKVRWVRTNSPTVVVGWRGGLGASGGGMDGGHMVSDARVD